MTFPDQLPYDCIQCFCPPNSVVLDPFMGSGTTARAAIRLERHWIGCEISEEYTREVAEITAEFASHPQGIFQLADVQLERHKKIPPQHQGRVCEARTETIIVE